MTLHFRKALRLFLCVSALPAIAAATDTAGTPVPMANDSTAVAAPANDPAAEKARIKEARAAEKAKQVQLREWKRLYGPGPYPDELDAFTATREEKLRAYYRVLYADGEHNSVLNYQRLGLLAMELGFYKDAEQAFDGALGRIEAFYAKDKQASKADDLTRKEVNKDFKGEPYERSMAYYYRGLLYLRAGDYDNARASFKAAEYQDTVSEAEQFKEDFGLLSYLSAWSSRCAGDTSLADETFALAAKMDSNLIAPPARNNVLMIAELGTGPLKKTTGKYNEALTFERATGSAEDGAIIALNGHDQRLSPAADLYVQASTRGGRAIDRILNGKAETKESLQTTGNAMMQAGLMQGGDAGMYAAGIGALVGLLSSAVRPTADIRAWDSLPNNIVIGTVAMPPNADLKTNVRYFKGEQQLDTTGIAPMVKNAGKCAIIWARSFSVAGLAPVAPGDEAKIANNRKKDADAWAKDVKFRAALAGN